MSAKHKHVGGPVTDEILVAVTRKWARAMRGIIPGSWRGRSDPQKHELAGLRARLHYGGYMTWAWDDPFPQVVLDTVAEELEDSPVWAEAEAAQAAARGKVEVWLQAVREESQAKAKVAQAWAEANAASAEARVKTAAVDRAAIADDAITWLLRRAEEAEAHLVEVLEVLRKEKG